MISYLSTENVQLAVVYSLCFRFWPPANWLKLSESLQKDKNEAVS